MGAQGASLPKERAAAVAEIRWELTPGRKTSDRPALQLGQPRFCKLLTAGPSSVSRLLMLRHL